MPGTVPSQVSRLMILKGCGRGQLIVKDDQGNDLELQTQLEGEESGENGGGMVEKGVKVSLSREAVWRGTKTRRRTTWLVVETLQHCVKAGILDDSVGSFVEARPIRELIE
jgi:hypothetical protein